MVNTRKWWLLSVLIPNFLLAQEVAKLTLEVAYSQAEKSYPIIKQKALVRQTADLNTSNLSKSYLPQFSLAGQATYQSDVTKVDIPFPGINIPVPQKDQYKITADISQVLYDGGVIKQQKILQELI